MWLHPSDSSSSILNLPAEDQKASPICPPHDTFRIGWVRGKQALTRFLVIDAWGLLPVHLAFSSINWLAW